MPTIDIPDKICPHCGGIRWRTEYRKKPTKTDPNKKLIRYRCVVQSQERVDRWIKNNIDKYKSITRNRNKKRVGYYTTPEFKEYYRQRAKRESSTASDNFIKAKIMKSVQGISRSDISQKLINVTRKHLLLTRKLKQLQK